MGREMIVVGNIEICNHNLLTPEMETFLFYNLAYICFPREKMRKVHADLNEVNLWMGEGEDLGLLSSGEMGNMFPLLLIEQGKRVDKIVAKMEVTSGDEDEIFVR